METIGFWEILLCNLEDMYQHCGGTFYIHLPPALKIEVAVSYRTYKPVYHIAWEGMKKTVMFIVIIPSSSELVLQLFLVVDAVLIFLCKITLIDVQNTRGVEYLTKSECCSAFVILNFIPFLLKKGSVIA